MPVIDILLGTAGFGDHGRITTLAHAKEIVDTFTAAGYSVVDTAYIYPGGFQGESESFLGALDVSRRGIQVDTKVRSFEREAHTPKSIIDSVDIQFRRLKVDKVRTLYLHCPDRSTPFEDTYRAIDNLFRAGKFERFGLSNFKAEEVETFVELAEKHAFVRPSVYQGLYNMFSRRNEEELLPTLRKHNISYFAFSPLAVGFFNIRRGHEPGAGSRFDPSTRQGKRSRERWFKESFFEAVERIRETGAKYSISTNSIALRWLKHHSQLTDGDAIIIGASNFEQVKQNLASLSDGPLPDEIVKLIDEVWLHVKNDAPPYTWVLGPPPYSKSTPTTSTATATSATTTSATTPASS
ncbi:NADP-dependent oxidoreductase domain-containing protein [Lipomyces oligophaga]|uniref:NADP-dependent oxidoreductase domain-containing protein n=1 Tax=Lipomyces oligophaga TaxID=45792 RepID=UPI0034CFE944